MNRPLIAVLAVAAVTVASGSDSCSTPENNASNTPAVDRDESASPDPKAKYTTRCDYLLGNFTEGPDGYKFVAGGKVRNTGNVGIVVRLVAKWQQLGTDPVRVTRRARVRVGRSKRLNVSVPATLAQISAHQSADGECSARLRIVDTFG